MIPLRHVPDMLSTPIHNDIPIRLLESREDIHEFQLPLHDDGRVREDAGGCVRAVQDAVGVVREPHGGYELVVGDFEMFGGGGGSGLAASSLGEAMVSACCGEGIALLV